MRFVADGPIIPDTLLRERDAGRVVFLCGAGVSVPAGMPNFVQLTKLVIDDLAPAPDSEVVQAFEPWVSPELGIPTMARASLDQIFNMLQQDYGRDQVGKFVTKHLAINDSSEIDTIKHKIIARISSNHDGSPQIVTTNFDHLFEYALHGKNAKFFEPPSFPELRHGVPITGISYLHGRLVANEAITPNYVLSSADFGRAYLAEGWATSFIRALLEQYTVVLLGYQAEDPPVKYLLQGLRSGRDQDRHALYAFDLGRIDEIESKWRDRGVIPIAYVDDHQRLWDTLEEWAKRSDDPKAWNSSVLAMAQRGPETLKPHERGMVCHFVKTAYGAKLFADSNPIPPAEWLCVFDKNCRSAQTISSHVPEERPFVPREAFGLDDDPIWEREQMNGRDPKCDDLISWRRGTESRAAMYRLSGPFPGGYDSIPARVFHLTRWMAKTVNQPTLAWWTARQSGLHPRLRAFLKSAVDDAEDLPKPAYRLWRIILETVATPKGVHGHSWSRFRREVSRNGWSSSMLRAFQKVTEPTFKIKRPGGIANVKPPPKKWNDTKWREIAVVDVEFPNDFRKGLEIPNEVLPEIFGSLQWNLFRTIQRLEECDKRWFRVGSLYQRNNEKKRHVSKSDALVFYFVSLLDRMAENNPTLLKGHIETWPQPDRYIFDKLRLYVLNKPELFASQEVATLVLSFPRTRLWDPRDKQEILFLLRDRWPEFSSGEKWRIAERILDGPPQFSGEGKQQYEMHRREEAAIRFGWLVQAGCDMPEALCERWVELKHGITGWEDAWAGSAAAIPQGKSYWVRTDEDASVLEGLPLSRIVEVASKNTGRSSGERTERRPFVGLVKERPSRAILALAIASRQELYPIPLWSELVRYWPNNTSNRANTIFCERIRRLPMEVVVEISDEIGTWLKENLGKFAEIDEPYAFKLYDHLLPGLLERKKHTAEFSVSVLIAEGIEVGQSRRIMDHAINSPVGNATQTLLSMLGARNPPADQGMPSEFSSRLDRLLDVTGEGEDHAACLVAQRIDWLNHIGPEWVKKKIVPWFEIDHPRCEAAWSGVLWHGEMPSGPVFDQLKDAFVRLFPKVYSWNWNDAAEESAHQWVVAASVFSNIDSTGITFEQARQCVRQMTQDGQQSVIHFLGLVGQDNEDGWSKYVIPFIENVWPREARFQRESTTQAWTTMLANTDEKFPDVLRAVRSFLRPLRSVHYDLYDLQGETKDQRGIIARFPEQTLDLLDLIVSDVLDNIPYDLDEVLEALEDAQPVVVTDRRFARLQELSALQ